ncbi:hypothetical protein SAMN04490182_4779 [Pseudomonas cedrina]|uniref:Diguanylate cyclase n=1 Tax=Pseudomonas cedrina TaxID=651740 RepID=A0ABY0V0N2_PSECE|nr:hypothetical protein SAMN04490182_4779 [Pseudomonas cedrina]
MPSFRTQLGQSTGMHFQTFSLTAPCKKALQKPGPLPNLCGNTPAMPLAASVAKHKLCGFFMPGAFRA